MNSNLRCWLAICGIVFVWKNFWKIHCWIIDFSMVTINWFLRINEFTVGDLLIKLVLKIIWFFLYFVVYFFGKRVLNWGLSFCSNELRFWSLKDMISYFFYYFDFWNYVSIFIFKATHQISLNVVYFFLFQII